MQAECHARIQSKLQVAMGFLRNTGTDRTREASGPTGPTGPLAPRGRSVRPSVKYVDDIKSQDPHPLTE